MNCTKCNTPLKDSARFCPACGHAVGQPVIAEDDTCTLSQKPKKKRSKGGAIAVAVVLVGMVVTLLFGGGSAEKTAKQFVEGMLEGDAKKCVSLLTDDAVEQTGYETRKILINAMDDALEGMREEYIRKYGKKWKYQVTVVDAYEDTVEYYDGDYIGESVDVVLEIEHSGSGLLNDEEGRETETVILVKEGRKWYVSGFGF